MQRLKNVDSIGAEFSSASAEALDAFSQLTGKSEGSARAKYWKWAPVLHHLERCQSAMEEATARTAALLEPSLTRGSVLSGRRELRIRPAGRRISGALDALAAFSPSFMAEGRQQGEQREREAL